MEKIREHPRLPNVPNTVVIQRLHPDWRMVPHLDIFGWTERHAQLEEYLRDQVKCRRIGNIYFTSDREYVEAQSHLKSPIKHQFLNRPLVNTVEGILLILEKEQQKKKRSNEKDHENITKSNPCIRDKSVD